MVHGRRAIVAAYSHHRRCGAVEKAKMPSHAREKSWAYHLKEDRYDAFAEGFGEVTPFLAFVVNFCEDGAGDFCE